MREKVLDFWFDFASTYSYPAAQRIGPLATKARVKVRFRPFLLGPIFLAQGWDTSPFNLFEAKGRNMWRDLERLCADLDLPFERPEMFPQQSVLAARVALIGLKLQEKWGKNFCLALFRAEFGEGKRIDDPAVISDILTRLKVDPATCAGSSALRGVAGWLAYRDRGSAAARHFRRADLRDAGRRIVLGE